MKKFISLIAMTAILYNECPAQQKAFSTSTFHWLAGTWENMDMRDGESGFETWTIDASGNLTGLGCTLRGTDTVFIEKLKIVEKDGHCYYVADVRQNAAPVYFKMTTANESGFICENPDHDFPQKISYQLDGDVITATISAGDKEMAFRFKRKK